jgi:signal transduction histidine kinase
MLPRARLQRLLWRIASPDSVTWLSFWLTFAAVIIGSLFVTTSGISWSTRVAVNGVGHLVLWAPLVLARWVTLRMDPERRTTIAWIILGAFVVGATLRTLVVGAIFSGLMGPDSALWLQRANGSFITIGIVFALTAYTVSGARAQRRRIQELNALQVELQESASQVQAGIQERGEQSVERVRGVLEAELATMQLQDAGADVKSLERIAREVVRPLSHDLADVSAVEPAPLPATLLKVSWIKVVDLATRGRPLRPLAVMLLMFILVFGATAAYPTAAVRFLVLPPVTFFVLRLVNPVAERVIGARQVGLRFAILVGASMVCGLIMGAVGYLVMVGMPIRQGTVLGAIFFVTIFTLGASVNAAVDASRQVAIDQLDAAAAQLRRNLALVNQVRWFQDRALSLALHGPVQAAISAAAYRLNSAMKSGEVTPELVDQVREDIKAKLDVLGDSTREAVPFAEGISSVVTTWDGVCQVEAVIDPDVSTLLEGDAPLRACLVAIAIEGVSNAVRHGGSTAVDLRMSIDGDAGVVLVYVASRAPHREELPSLRISGLGMRQINDCAITWNLEVKPDGQILRAALPSRLLLT